MTGLLGCLLCSGACSERQALDDALAPAPDGDPPGSTAVLDPDFVSIADSPPPLLNGGISTGGLQSLAPGNYVPATDTDDAERALGAAIQVLRDMGDARGPFGAMATRHALGPRRRA